MTEDNNVYAAIALALHEYLTANSHDGVSGVITIKERPTQWNNFSMVMTAMPSKG